jgi:hypothetical protein
MSLFWPTTSHPNCTASAIPLPNLNTGYIDSLTAKPEYSSFQYIPAGLYFNNGAVSATGLSYCKVSISYTDFKSNRKTGVQVWLPSEKWNGRMQGIGGGGWSAGLVPVFDNPSMTAAVAQGYVAVATDGGWSTSHPMFSAYLPNKPGQVDLKALRHYGATSLKDVSILGKAVAASFYGTPPRYSYWNGCSQGGRQGFMIAQEYPDAFDGVAAAAPPVNWGPLIVAGFSMQVLMHDIDKYVHPCEIAALSARAMEECDPLDGVVDGLISEPDRCFFNPYPWINTTANCYESPNMTISAEAAYIANTFWTGLYTSNQTFMHFGANHEASLVSLGVPYVGWWANMLGITLGLSDRMCDAKGKCTGRPFSMIDEWIRYFVVKDPRYDTSKMSMQDFDDIMEISTREYTSIIGTGSTNLTGFGAAGKKMLSYHGLVG